MNHFLFLVWLGVVSVSLVPCARAVDLARPAPETNPAATGRPVALRASSSIADLAGAETPVFVIANGGSTALSLDGSLTGAFPRLPEVQPNWFESLRGGTPSGPSHNCGAGGASGSVMVGERRLYYRIGADGGVELREDVRAGGPYWRVRAPVANVSVADFMARLPANDHRRRFRALQNSGVDRLASLLPPGARAAFETELAEALAPPPRRRTAEPAEASPDVREGVEALRSFCNDGLRGRDGVRECEANSRRVALVPLLVRSLSGVQTTVPVRSLVIERCRASDGRCALDSPAALVPDREAPAPPSNATDAELDRLSRQIEAYRRAFSRRRGIQGEPLDVALSASGQWEIVGLTEPADSSDEGLEGFRANLSRLRRDLERARAERVAHQRRTGAYVAENRLFSDLGIVTTSFRLMALNNCCKDTVCRQEIVATGAVRGAGGAPTGGGVPETREPRTAP